MAAILKEEPPELSDDEPEHRRGSRTHRPPLPRKESGATISIGVRHRLRPRGPVRVRCLGTAIGTRVDHRSISKADCPGDRSPRPRPGGSIRGPPDLEGACRRVSVVPPADLPARFRHSGRFSPDGHTVFYAANWDGAEKSQLFSVRTENPGSLPLDLPSGQVEAISRSGDMLILSDVLFSLGYAHRGVLRSAPLSGGAARDLFEDVVGADWSPDGTSLALIRAPGWRHRLEYPAGKVLYEPAGWISHPRVSPHGRRRGDSSIILSSETIPVRSRSSIGTAGRPHSRTDGSASRVWRGLLPGRKSGLRRSRPAAVAGSMQSRAPGVAVSSPDRRKVRRSKTSPPTGGSCSSIPTFGLASSDSARMQEKEASRGSPGPPIRSSRRTGKKWSSPKKKKAGEGPCIFGGPTARRPCGWGTEKTSHSPPTASGFLLRAVGSLRRR